MVLEGSHGSEDVGIRGVPVALKAKPKTGNSQEV
jgi:hypothetical protein